VIIQLEYDGVIGYGESTMPPYLGESQESVHSFLNKITTSKYASPFDIDTILDEVDSIEDGNNAAKAGFDIALHDLVCKLNRQSLADFYNVPQAEPLSSFTIGIDSPIIMAEKVNEAKELGFKILKIKLGSTYDDSEIMDRILNVWKGPFSIDANQGWKDKEATLDFIHFLKEKGASFIEQPFLNEDFAASAWLTERSPLPIIADESMKRFKDFSAVQSSFHGINVKLMKSTGLREAYRMINEAKRLGMKVVTGCMAESSCAVTAMSNFAPLADWVDLDGPFLITNDPFSGVTLKNGKLIHPNIPGIGVVPES
jgi:L-alanine-DL-glutamate epimerase-like enolase superfamily enzyme